MTSKALAFFEQIMYEAEGDDPPELMPDAPPDVDEGINDAPPDLGGDSNFIDADPPGGDMGDIGDYETSDDLEYGEDSDTAAEDNENLELGEKISSIFNANLYRRFLTLNNSIANQISSIKVNNDVLYSISPKSISIMEQLKKLEENIILYLSHYFMNNDYSKNLLYFNKCINLLKLLNDIFDKDLRKGFKDISNN